MVPSFPAHAALLSCQILKSDMHDIWTIVHRACSFCEVHIQFDMTHPCRLKESDIRLWICRFMFHSFQIGHMLQCRDYFMVVLIALISLIISEI